MPCPGNIILSVSGLHNFLGMNDDCTGTDMVIIFWVYRSLLAFVENGVMIRPSAGMRSIDKNTLSPFPILTRYTLFFYAAYPFFNIYYMTAKNNKV